MKPEVCRPLQGLIVLIGSAVLLCIIARDFGFGKGRNPEEPDVLAGRLVRWSPKLRLSDHAEVLTSSLEDPRGLAYDDDGRRILIADGPRRKLISYSIKDGRIEQPAGDQPYEYCLQVSCEETDPRGITIWSGNLYVAEHGLNRIAMRTICHKKNGQSDEHDQDYEGNFPEQPSQLNGPSSIAFNRDGDTAFVTDDRPWPGSAGQQTAYDSADYAHWLDHNTPRLFGSVYQIKIKEEEGMNAELIDATLPHPSGIALSPDGMTLYVAICDGHQTQWVVFKRASLGADAWKKSGVLASEKLKDGIIPPYQGIVTDESGQFIYAAGPGGLYILDSTGTGLGRMEFDGRVTGLAWGTDADGCGNYLYFAAGHTLCRLKIDTGSK
jgi:sugar lactone lactonase YvrE